MVAPTLPASPPQRAPEIVEHLSAGRYLAARRYVIGWADHDLVKIGCASGAARVRRFTRTRGAELLDLAYYDRLYDDVRAEVWLDQAASALWPSAFRRKEDARFLLGNDTAGWTEFLRIPVEDWPTLQLMAAI